ncbi:serum amyloid P-component-like [Halichoeres trimaculatus]|uniref:serum amyloid P-component-like n=1 Tax=Halichoeres trimaculatus TaxID=147232 RepID=UPI003D9ED108
MKQLLVLLASLCIGHAVQKDLSEKVFTFPVAGHSANVKLVPVGEAPLTALTMCMRFFSTHTGSQSLFSMALPSNPDAFFLFKPSLGVYRLHINGEPLDIKGLPDELNEWNSVCWTWSSNNGLTTLWVNRKRSARKALGANFSFRGRLSIILGQDQDSYGGMFDASQAFVGDITDVHLWSSVLTPCEIRSFMDGGLFTSGNLLNWKNLQYSTSGRVHEETSDFGQMC